MPGKPGREGVKQDMKRFAAGKLHSGSKKGPVVKSRKQAIAIALSEAGMSRQRKKGGARTVKRGNQHMTSETSRYDWKDNL